MKLPSFKRIFYEAFDAKYKDLIQTLSITLNYSIEALYNTLNKNVSLNDNILCSIKDITVTVDTNGVPKVTTSFSIDTYYKVIGVVVLSANNTTNSNIYPSSGVFVSFTQSNQTVFIDHITGLQANNNYALKLVAFG